MGASHSEGSCAAALAHRKFSRPATSPNGLEGNRRRQRHLLVAPIAVHRDLVASVGSRRRPCRANHGTRVLSAGSKFFISTRSPSSTPALLGNSSVHPAKAV